MLDLQDHIVATHLKIVQAAFPSESITEDDFNYILEALLSAQELDRGVWPTSFVEPGDNCCSSKLIHTLSKVFDADCDVLIRLFCMLNLPTATRLGVTNQKCVIGGLFVALVMEGHASVQVQPSGTWMVRATNILLKKMAGTDDAEPKLVIGNREYTADSLPKWNELTTKQRRHFLEGGF